ncbi:MAG: cytochrome c4 [Thiobacillaceae bacterium]|jgi:cytochrome c553|nr:cytochrome c4 [Thiobacillaceae bacterium]
MPSPTSKTLAALALFVGGMAAVIAAEALKGDVAKGKSLADEACASCHGPDGNSEVPTFPKLAGQHETYLVRELQDYKAGRRANEIMTPIVAGLSDQDMANVAAYYAKQAPSPGTVTNPALLALGKRVYLEGNSDSGVPSCDGCHEEGGEGSKRFPRVAGQHVEYTLDQIRQYASGQRSNGVKVMRTISQRMTEDEAKAVAEYMASLK